MIGYITLGTNDIDKSAAFYDALFETVGVSRGMSGNGFISWSASPTQPAVSIIKPYDGNAATVGNGTMISLIFDSPEKVDTVHAKALELGGKDEGPVGPRGDSGFYAGYFRDLDGNKLCAFCMTK